MNQWETEVVSSENVCVFFVVPKRGPKRVIYEQRITYLLTYLPWTWRFPEWHSVE